MKTQFLALAVAASLMTSTVVASAASYTDVPTSSPYATYINDLTSKFIVQGKGNNAFDPTGPLTRAEFCVMILKAFNVPMTTDAVKFSDSKTHWAKFYIQSAYKAGIVAGTSDTTFSPDQSLTREQAATMVWNYLSAHGASSTTTTLAGDYDSWAAKALSNVVGLKLYAPQEVTNGDYHAKDTMTRQEAAALIDLSLNEVKGSTTTQPSGGSTTPPSSGWGPKPVNNWVVTPLVKNSDGTYSPNNPPFVKGNQSLYTATQIQGYESLFNQAKISFNGDSVVVTVPPTGSNGLRWSIQDDNGNAWEGSDAKTMTLTSNRVVEVSLDDYATAHGLIDVHIFNNNGQWTAKVDEN